MYKIKITITLTLIVKVKISNFYQWYVVWVQTFVLCTSIIVFEEYLSAVDQTNPYKMGICCFPAKHAALRSKKDWLARNQDNMSEWGDMSIQGLLFQ